MWWSIAWNFITGNLGGIVTAITGYMGKMSDNDTAKLKTAIAADRDVAIAQLQASSNVYHDRADMLKGMGVTQWLIAAALIPPLYHQAGVFLDSCPWMILPYFSHHVGSWNFVKLPPPYDDREQILIASLLGIQGAMTTGLGIAKALIRR